MVGREFMSWSNSAEVVALASTILNTGTCDNHTWGGGDTKEESSTRKEMIRHHKVSRDRLKPLTSRATHHKEIRNVLVVTQNVEKQLPIRSHAHQRSRTHTHTHTEHTSFTLKSAGSTLASPLKNWCHRSRAVLTTSASLDAKWACKRTSDARLSLPKWPS